MMLLKWIKWGNQVTISILSTILSFANFGLKPYGSISRYKIMFFGGKTFVLKDQIFFSYYTHRDLYNDVIIRPFQSHKDHLNQSPYEKFMPLGS